MGTGGLVFLIGALGIALYTLLRRLHGPPFTLEAAMRALQSEELEHVHVEDVEGVTWHQLVNASFSCRYAASDVEGGRRESIDVVVHGMSGGAIAHFTDAELESWMQNTVRMLRQPTPSESAALYAILRNARSATREYEKQAVAV